MKRLALLFVCIFCTVSAGCAFNKIDQISAMTLSGINIPALGKDFFKGNLFKKCTFYQMEEKFGVSSYDDNLYMDADGNLYFYYTEFCDIPHCIIVNTKDKKLKAKQIADDIKKTEINHSTKIPLMRLKARYFKAVSADNAILLCAKIKDRQFQKKCDVGVGDIEFELIKAKNIFYLLSILNTNEQTQILNQLSDRHLTHLITDYYGDIEDIIKVANSNAEFRQKLDKITVNSIKIKNRLKSMNPSQRKAFLSRIDSSEYKSLILSVLERNSQ